MRRLSNWKTGWLGRLLGLHSPAAHSAGACWCKGTKREIFPEQITAPKIMSDLESFYRFISEIDCANPDCKYRKPHRHGFACDVTCTTCLGLTKIEEQQ